MTGTLPTLPATAHQIESSMREEKKQIGETKEELGSVLATLETTARKIFSRSRMTLSF